jgi:hypothetical protein
MGNSVIFNSPLLLLCFFLAFLFDLFEIKKKATGYVCPLLSLLAFAGSLTYSLLLGASYKEASIMILIFLMLNMTIYLQKKEVSK